MQAVQIQTLIPGLMSGQDDTMENNYHTEFAVEHRKDHTYTVPDHVGDTVKIVPEGTFEQIRIANEQATASPEEFFAEGTTPLADTSVKVDGDRTQLTEAEATAATDAVLDQTLTSRDLDAVTSAVGLETMLLRKEVAELRESNKKIIAALKHLGLDTNKHFR